MPQTKEAKRAGAIARNEHNRKKYEEQARKAGITDPASVSEFADRKIGIPKKPKSVAVDLKL